MLTSISNPSCQSSDSVGLQSLPGLWIDGDLHRLSRWRWRSPVILHLPCIRILGRFVRFRAHGECSGYYCTYLRQLELLTSRVVSVSTFLQSLSPTECRDVACGT